MPPTQKIEEWAAESYLKDTFRSQEMTRYYWQEYNYHELKRKLGWKSVTHFAWQRGHRFEFVHSSSVVCSVTRDPELNILLTTVNFLYTCEFFRTTKAVGFSVFSAQAASLARSLASSVTGDRLEARYNGDLPLQACAFRFCAELGVHHAQPQVLFFFGLSCLR